MEISLTHYVLIDHENVHTLDPGQIAGKPVKVFVFIGSQTTKLAVEDVKRLLMHPGQIELIQMSGQGKNALDFHIAFYAGRISARNSRAVLHVVSKDTGFDPLIIHLRSLGVEAHRTADVPKIGASKVILPVPEKPAALPGGLLEERLQRVLEYLSRNAKSRPRLRKTLKSSIAALFANQVGNEEIDLLVVALVRSGKLHIDGKEAVTYRL